MAFIFHTSSIPGSDIPSLFPFQDIFYHLLIYLILSLFFMRALKNTFSNIKRSEVIFFTIIFVVSYGLSDELHQAFVPDRSVSFFDLLIDGIGAFSGTLFYR